MMERSGKKTGRWDYASGQVIDPDKVVLGHETAVEFKPGQLNEEFWNEAERIMCVDKYRTKCMDLEGVYGDFWSCNAVAQAICETKMGR